MEGRGEPSLNGCNEVPKKCNTSYTLIKYTAGYKNDKDKRDRGL
jgi:hypothetical protein